MGYARRNFLVPVPSFPSFDALNAHLEERCLERLGRQLRGHKETIGQRMERDLETLLALPAVPYDASDKHVSRVSSLSLVRYRTNDCAPRHAAWDTRLNRENFGGDFWANRPTLKRKPKRKTACR